MDTLTIAIYKVPLLEQNWKTPQPILYVSPPVSRIRKRGTANQPPPLLDTAPLSYDSEL